MLRENRGMVIITSIVTVLPMLAGIILWNRLPSEMAIHFSTNNVANGFSGKGFAVFGLPLICLAIQWLCILITTHDPKKQDISRKVFTLVLWIVPVVSVFTSALIYSYNLGTTLNITFLSSLFVGAVLVIVGNYLPKARQNYTIGIRVPWTLANQENWNKTHRLAGFLWTAAGICLTVLAISGLLAPSLMFAVVIVVAVLPIAYSFYLHAARGL